MALMVIGSLKPKNCGLRLSGEGSTPSPELLRSGSHGQTESGRARRAPGDAGAGLLGQAHVRPPASARARRQRCAQGSPACLLPQDPRYRLGRGGARLAHGFVGLSPENSSPLASSTTLKTGPTSSADMCIV